MYSQFGIRGCDFIIPYPNARPTPVGINKKKHGRRESLLVFVERKSEWRE